MSKLWSAIKLLLKMAVLTLAVAIFAGVVYEQMGQRQDFKEIPRIGRSVDIGGRSLNINCTGQGSPTVLPDSGTNNPGYAWVLVPPMVDKFTRVCWYDRAGDGWSDPGPFPRTREAIAKDLHALVSSAGIRPPYLLVGHSFGGTNMRVYNGLFPSDVAGMVLVDAWHEDEVKRLPRRKGSGPPDALRPAIDALTPAFTSIGLVRLFQRPLRNSPPKGLTAEQWLIMQRLRRLPKAMAAESSSGLTQEQSAQQVRKASGLGDRPLIVLRLANPSSAAPILRWQERRRKPRTFGSTNCRLNSSSSPLEGDRRWLKTVPTEFLGKPRILWSRAFANSS